MPGTAASPIASPLPAPNLPGTSRAGAGRVSRACARLALGVLLALVAAPAAADLPPFAEPTFLIETLRVEGLGRASSELILSESLLEAGTRYGESELKQAVFRIQRLPFVLDASFAIEKGSERGSYVLVIRVEEIRRWFFGEDARITVFTNSVAFDAFAGQDFSASLSPQVGFRFYTGRYGVFFASIAGNQGLQLGYTRYNLLDRRIVLSAGFTPSGCCPVETFSLGLDPTFSSWQTDESRSEIRLALGVPLGQRTSLQLEATGSFSEQGRRRNLLGLDSNRAELDFFDRAHGDLRLSLTYDSSDDPVFPTTGVRAIGTLGFEGLESDFAVGGSNALFPFPRIEVPAELEDGLPTFESRLWRLSASVEQHWALSRRLTVSLSARLAAGVGRLENLPIVEQVRDCPPVDFDCRPSALRLIGGEDLEVFESLLTAGLSADVWGPRRTRRYGDFRFEAALEFGYDRTSPSLDLEDNPLYRKGILTSLVFRNEWGLFRLSFDILDFGNGL